ncbi:MAG TPA: alpha/beta family hydrolase [Jatrophihabitantaceae bacterium]|nr:alpha/beta family hydrolase [Jatrophihabitantaceae bacterium]
MNSAATARIEIVTPSGPAWADIDRPPTELAGPTALMVLGHGAGGGVDAPDLVAVRDAATAAGIVVARVTQPYRVAGRRAPAPAARLDEAWLCAITAITGQPGLAELALVVGGRSSGARVACRTAAHTGARAVVSLAFPVHPPGKPERSRLDELALPGTRVLVVQGDRDPFGMPPKARGRTLVVIAGADHSLRKDPAGVAAAVVDFVVGVSVS